MAAVEGPLMWVDCDPGHDDFFALQLAAWGGGRLLGVSTSAGNQTIEKTTRNALRSLYACGKGGPGGVAVHRGRARALLRPELVCPEIHGESGLDGPAWPAAADALQPVQGNALLAIRAALLAAPAPVSLVVTGALTNAAAFLLAFGDDADVRARLRDVVLLGGCAGTGNIGPVMEFNIMVDPEAAAVVFASGVRVVQVPLEVSHRCLVTKPVLTRIQTDLRPGSRYAHLARDLLLFFAKTYLDVFAMPDPPLHDPLAVAYVLAPHLFKLRLLRVDVELVSPLTAGQTVMDVWGSSGRTPNVYVAQDVDVAAFWDLLFAALRLADAHSPLNDDLA